jgi:glycerol-3-phosphate dehydrogenase
MGLKIQDLLVIGGGINGVGITRDAVGRGLNVVLCEQDDLAQHTSSSSTKLIHGGLRYLENYDFMLVRHALEEREILLKSAPHIIWPLRFLLPHHKALRPRWLIRLGLFLYDHIGGRKILPASHGVDFRRHVGGEPLQSQYTRGFEYSDCWVQDARLVVLNARDAKARGAQILTRTKCTALHRDGDCWQATLTDNRDGRAFQIQARAVVNATGPWVEKTLRLDNTVDSDSAVRLVKGSHIVVPKMFDHEFPYIFQHADGRVVFAIPYEQDFTLLGTTDVEITGDPGKVSIDESEVSYICDAINQYFKTPVKPDDVVWGYAGVRPLFDDHSGNASKVTRDYVLQLDDEGPPIVSVFGGKITTYRKLSEQVVDMLKAPMNFEADHWTANTTLPGGDMENSCYDKYLAVCQQNYPWLADAVLNDYVRNYGSEIEVLLQGRSDMTALGENFGGGLYACEVEFLIEYEWAETIEDVLWRRSKKGLHVPTGTDKKLRRWMADYTKNKLSPHACA